MPDKNFPFFDLPDDLQKIVLNLYGRNKELQLVCWSFYAHAILKELGSKEINDFTLNLMLYWIKENKLPSSIIMDQIAQPKMNYSFMYELLKNRLQCRSPLIDLPQTLHFFSEKPSENVFKMIYPCLSDKQQKYLICQLLSDEKKFLSSSYIKTIQRFNGSLCEDSTPLSNFILTLPEASASRESSRKKLKILNHLKLLAPLLTENHIQTKQILLSYLSSRSENHKMAAWEIILDLTAILTLQEKQVCLTLVPNLLKSTVKRVTSMGFKVLSLFIREEDNLSEQSPPIKALLSYLVSVTRREEQHRWSIHPEIFETLTALAFIWKAFNDSHPIILFLIKTLPYILYEANQEIEPKLSFPDNIWKKFKTTYEDFLKNALKTLKILVTQLHFLPPQSKLMESLLMAKGHCAHLVIPVLKEIPAQLLALWAEQNTIRARFDALLEDKDNPEYLLRLLALPDFLPLLSKENCRSAVNFLLQNNEINKQLLIEIIYNFYLFDKTICMEPRYGQFLDHGIVSYNGIDNIPGHLAFLIAQRMVQHQKPVDRQMWTLLSHLSTCEAVPEDLQEELLLLVLNNPVSSLQQSFEIAFGKAFPDVKDSVLLIKLIERNPNYADITILKRRGLEILEQHDIAAPGILELLKVASRMIPELTEDSDFLFSILELARAKSYFSLQHLELVQIWISKNPAWLENKQALIACIFDLAKNIHSAYLMELLIELSDLNIKADLKFGLWEHHPRSGSVVLFPMHGPINALYLTASLIHPDFFDKSMEEVLASWPAIPSQLQKQYLTGVFRKFAVSDIKSNTSFMQSLLKNQDRHLASTLVQLFFRIFSREELWALLKQQTCSSLMLLTVLEKWMPVLSQKEAIETIELLKPYMMDKNALQVLSMIAKIFSEKKLSVDFETVFGQAEQSLFHSLLFMYCSIKNQIKTIEPELTPFDNREAVSRKRKRESLESLPLAKRYRLFDSIVERTPDKPDPNAERPTL